MAWQVTVESGLKEVVLPDGLRYQGGDVAVLDDAQYGSMSANAVATLFSAVEQIGGGGGGGGSVSSVNDVDPVDGNVTLTPASIGAVSGTGGGKETIGALGDVTGTATVSLADGNVFTATMTGGTTWTFSGATSGKSCSFDLRLSQDGTGGRVATWPGSVTWVGGTAPSPDTSAGALSVYSFESLDGGTTWLGSLVQELPSWALASAAAAILALLAGGVTLPAYLAPAVVTLAQSGGSVALDGTLGNIFRLTLTASGWTLANPTGLADGQPVEVDLIQGTGGGFTISYGSAWDFGAAGEPTLSVTAGKVDYLIGRYSAVANGGAGAVVVSPALGY
jgi:hypothetical protein